MSLRPNILLVDDEERFVKSLHATLKYYDYECTEAFSGGEAIRLLNEKNYDLILLDVNMPDMSGCDVIEAITASDRQTTIVMLTGVSTIETAVRSLKLGAYDFLSKPVSHGLLLKTMEKALQHHRLTCEIEASERKFQALAEAAWEGIAIHENGNLIEANKQFYMMFGYEEKELTKNRFLERILTSDSLVDLNRGIDPVISGMEITGMKKDGTVFPLEAKYRSINYLGKPVCVIAIRDISDRVSAEAEKLVLQNRLAKANTLEALGRMAGYVAHDLNNTLSGVVSYPDLLLARMKESDEFYSKIRKIQNAGRRAAAVVADLVMLTRGGVSSKTIENINDIILRHLGSIEHNEQMAHYPEVTLLTDLQPDLHNTRCSIQHFHRILLNLIGNALEAIPGKGQIRITTQNCKFPKTPPLDGTQKKDEDSIKISIADNGPGISSKDVEHIFEPFYSTKVMGKSGTGLGLSIVWSTVQDLNGWVEVKDNHPGAVFEIYLPASFEKSCSTGNLSSNHSLRGNGESVLLIDDNQEQNEIIGNLVNYLGYKTYTVTSGEEGIAFLKDQAVDLILLDMIMGDGMNGRETFERILAIHPGQKAIMISGYAKNEEVMRAKALGISHILDKPVTLFKLGQAIKQSFSGN